MLGHMMLANVLGQEFVCTEAEALKLATAYVNLRKHYPALPIDPKTMAWITLGIVAVSVEAPKIRARSERVRAERAMARAEEQVREQSPGGTVVPLDPALRDNPGFAGAWPRPQ